VTVGVFVNVGDGVILGVLVTSGDGVYVNVHVGGNVAEINRVAVGIGDGESVAVGGAEASVGVQATVNNRPKIRHVNKLHFRAICLIL